ncbi:MAG: cupin domain-containing protein [Acidobacteriota bacterium]
MRSLTINLTLAVTALAVAVQVGAQQKGGGAAGGAAQALKTFASSAEVSAMIAKSKNDRKEQPTISSPILRLAPYNANLEYRAAVGPAAVHETEAEMFYVIEGSATLVTGGKLIAETRTNAANLSGTGIEGGTPQPVAKGDFVIVPEGTPHWFSPINGTLVLMSIHVPRPVAAAAK